MAYHIIKCRDCDEEIRRTKSVKQGEGVCFRCKNITRLLYADKRKGMVKLKNLKREKERELQRRKQRLSEETQGL